MGASNSIDQTTTNQEIITEIMNKTENNFTTRMKQIVDTKVKTNVDIKNKQEINISGSTVKNTKIKQDTIVKVSQSIANQMQSFYDQLTQTENANDAKQTIDMELEKSMETSAEAFTIANSYRDTETNLKQRVSYINETCNNILTELTQQFNTYCETGISMNMDQIVNISNAVVEDVEITQENRLDDIQTVNQEAEEGGEQKISTGNTNTTKDSIGQKQTETTVTKASSKGLMVVIVIVAIIVLVGVFLYLKNSPQAQMAQMAQMGPAIALQNLQPPVNTSAQTVAPR